MSWFHQDICYFCEAPINLYWSYCPWCSQMTDLGKKKQRAMADDAIKRMKERHEQMRSAGEGAQREQAGGVDEVLPSTSGSTPPPD